MRFERVLVVGLAAALLLPHAFSSVHDPAPRLGAPRVHDGDEPHYLVMLNSLLLDGDLDLARDYAAVHAGSDRAGRHQRGAPLAHHTFWLVDGERERWIHRYEVDPAHWARDAGGFPRPALREGAVPPPSGAPELTEHSTGLAFLLYPLTFPFRGSDRVESVALYASGVATLLALLAFLSLARPLAPDPRWVLPVAIVAFLGTPVWHYGRTLFTEPYLLACGLGAYALALRAGRPFASGCLIALGATMKPPFALIALPLAALFGSRRKLREGVAFGCALALGGALILALNHWLHGSPFRAAQPFALSAFPWGLYGLSISPSDGVLAYSPVLLVAAAGWPGLFHRHREDAAAVLAAVALYGSFMTVWASWDGGYCYGPRYLVPLIPFFMLGLLGLPRLSAPWRRIALASAIALGALSVAINALGALPYWRSWDVHPLAPILSGSTTTAETGVLPATAEAEPGP